MSSVKINILNGKSNVPDNPIIPFIEGYGTGPDEYLVLQLKRYITDLENFILPHMK